MEVIKGGGVHTSVVLLIGCDWSGLRQGNNVVATVAGGCNPLVGVFCS